MEGRGVRVIVRNEEVKQEKVTGREREREILPF